MEGAYGIRDIAMSMPAIIGKDGVEMQIPIALDEGELEHLQHSAEMLHDVMEQIDFKYL